MPWIQRLKCQQCAYKTNTENELAFHNESMHQQVISRNWCHRCNIEVDWGNIIDKHICRMPQYDPKNKCNFCKVDLFNINEKTHHICEQHPHKTVDQQRKRIKRRNTECTHGANCFRATKNRCWFKHSQPLNSLPHQGHIQNRQTFKPQLYCKYQETCFKGLACKFKHFPQGFLVNSQEQRHQ